MRSGLPEPSPDSTSVTRVAVFGLGHVGSVTAACLARAGHLVIGVDTDAHKVGRFNAGFAPVPEPGLDDLVARGVRDGRLRATTSAAEAVDASEVALLCVGTTDLPSGHLDLAALRRVSAEVGDALRHRTWPLLVVVRSTVLPGTTESVVIPELLGGGGLRSNATVHIAVNPAFMRQGCSLEDFAHPPFTLVGCEGDCVVGRVQALYDGVDAPFVTTSLRTAEMVKYVANAFHALTAAFANEVADVCAALGADAKQVMGVVELDRQLVASAGDLRPGFALNGPCVQEDLRVLLDAAQRGALSPPVLSAILTSNEARVRRGVEAVLATRAKRVGVVGLASRPGSDDLRGSPLVALVEALVGRGCEVRVFDPAVEVPRLVGATRSFIEQQMAALMCASLESLLAHAEVVVIGREGWEADRALAALHSRHVVVDLTRGALRTPMRPDAAA